MKTVLGVIAVLLIVYSQGSTDVYKTYLKEFDNVRSHVPHTQELVNNRNKVRTFMKTKFEAAGLDVQVMNFSTTDTNTGKAVSGTNLIATLKGSNYGTSKDEVIVLAAHIDTPKRDAGGVNNDGSGLVGLVTIAEALKGKESCSGNNSVIFAAFDRTETAEIGQNVTQCKKSCGSQEFIKNKASFLKGGKIKFVIVMDCIANFEHDLNTQHLSGVLSTYFPDWYEETQLSDFVGDYLAITGRNNEKAYLEEIKKIYEAVRVEPSKGRLLAATFQWNVNGVPNSQNKTVINSAFDNGDHMSFWDANIDAVLLTDTCYSRKPYQGINCDLSNTCDVFAKLKDDDFKFMGTVLSTVKQITKKYTCGACVDCDVNADCNGNTCTCKKGYTGNGKNCTDIDECKLNPCSKDAVCENKPAGSYQCRCKNGFTGDGKTCSDIDECKLNPCSKDAVCENKPAGSYQCRCKNGFTGDGKTCSGASVLQVIPQVLFFGLAMLLSYFWI